MFVCSISERSIPLGIVRIEQQVFLVMIGGWSNVMQWIPSASRSVGGFLVILQLFAPGILAK